MHRNKIVDFIILLLIVSTIAACFNILKAETQIGEPFVDSVFNSDKSNLELLGYAMEFRNISIDSALLYTDKIYQRAVLEDLVSDQIDALGQLSELNLQSGNTGLAYEQMNRISQLGEDSHAPEMKLKVNLSLGRIASIEHEYKGSLEYYFTALKYAELSDNQHQKGEIYYQIATIYFILGDFENIRYYLDKAFMTGYTKDPESYLRYEIIVGDTYLAQEQFDSALYCYLRVRNFAEVMPDNYEKLGTAYAYLSKYYLTINDLIEAESNCKLSIKYFELGHSLERMASLYTYLAHIYSLKDNYTQALVYNKIALKIRTRIGINTLIISSLNNIGGNFSELGVPDSALIYFNRALDIEKGNKSDMYKAVIYKNMYDLFLENNNQALALEYYRLYRDYTDSVLMAKNNKAISQMRIKFELEKEKNKFNAFELSKSKTIQIILISFSLVMVVMLLMLFNKFREKRQDNKLLLQKNKIIEEQNSQLETTLRELKASEQKYRTLSNNLPGLIFRLETNPVGHMIFYNNLLPELTGYSEAVLRRDYGNSLDQMILPDDLSTLQEARQKSIIENKPYNITYRFVHQGSTLKYINEIGVPVQDILNKQELIDGLIFDVTDKKLTEHELVIALEKARESDQLKSTFLSTLSHELRTPLNAIIGFSNLIDLDTPKQMVVDYLGIIRRSGDHLLELVEDLFDISLIETNNISLHQSVGILFETMSMVEHLSRFEQNKLNKQQVTINLSVPEDTSLKIYTDLRKLKQILINLLKNALKFTPSGTIDFGYQVEKHDENTFYRFFVIDTGIGIQQKNIDIIFDIFRQADDSLTRQYEGAGIGLSVAKRYIELLGGRIWVESTFGKGSAFYFTLSADLPDKQLIESDDFTIQEQENVRGKTILIVEDIPSAHVLLKVLLEREGFGTIWAKNGKEAVEFCHTVPEIRLVLMDLKMPDMSGFVAARIIKEDFPKLPIIAQTAFAVDGDRQLALEAGFDDYIEKPIQKNILLKLVYQYLSKSK
ncbi:MAG: hypothetical protein CVT99_03645 [Bacteroidetes bacterium HGW-Bacteroidetes-16]|jgi:PAS domain S-box-containing protein|nr:MAG: hypothetical protein CVT99_03645 [Bacteroidetes bacterium HGW-Bacteroidetes-16]